MFFYVKSTTIKCQNLKIHLKQHFLFETDSQLMLTSNSLSNSLSSNFYILNVWITSKLHYIPNSIVQESFKGYLETTEVEIYLAFPGEK